MKIAIINVCCKKLSTGKIAYSIYKILRELGHSSKVYYGRFKLFETEKELGEEQDLVYFGNWFFNFFHSVIGKLLGIQGLLSFYSTFKLIIMLNSYKPGVVFIFNLHESYINEFLLLLFLKYRHLSTFYMMVDEYPMLGKCAYAYKCEKYKIYCAKPCPNLKEHPKSYFFDNASLMFKLKKFLYKDYVELNFVGVQGMKEKFTQSALTRGRPFFTCNPIIDTNFYKPSNVESLQAQLSLGMATLVVVNVCVFSELRKGGSLFLETARKSLNADILFIHIGYDGSALDLPKNFLPVPYINNQEILRQYYSLADIFFCTSLSDALPNACVEALACGTPLLCFNCSGMPYITTRKYMHLLPVADTDKAAEFLVSYQKKSVEISNGCRNYAVENYSGSALKKRISQLIARIEQAQ